MAPEASDDNGAAGLLRRLELLCRFLPDATALITEYLSGGAAGTGQAGWCQAVHFLCWLPAVRSLTTRERDICRYEQAVCQVWGDLEKLSEKHRLFCAARLRSPALWLAADASSYRLEESCITVNPVCRWVSLSTPLLLDGMARPPAHVMVFPAEQEIRTVVFELEGLALLNWLIDNAPCQAAEWLADAGCPEALCRELLRLGLIAATRLPPNA